MTLYNSLNRILVTDVTDTKIIFDSQNSAPHYVGNASYSGTLQILGGNMRPWSTSYNKFFNDNVTEYLNLGIFESRPIDFLMANMRFVSQSDLGYIVVSFDRLIPIGQWFTLNGSQLVEQGRVVGTATSYCMVRKIELIKDADNQFKIKILTSTKDAGTSFYNDNWNSIDRRSAWQIEMNLYWGKFS